MGGSQVSAHMSLRAVLGTWKDAIQGVEWQGMRKPTLRQLDWSWRR